MEIFTSVSFKDTRKNTCLTLEVSLGHEPVQCVKNQISTYGLKKKSICSWKKKETLHTVAFKSFTHKNSNKKKRKHYKRRVKGGILFSERFLASRRPGPFFRDCEVRNSTNTPGFMHGQTPTAYSVVIIFSNRQ